MSFTSVLEKYRTDSFSKRDTGYRFEKLMKRFLQTYPIYSNKFSEVWLWSEFPYAKQFGGYDVGIDLVAVTTDNEFWAIQCKCYAEDTRIEKADVDSFLATSGKRFDTEDHADVGFSQRLWISTSDNWSKNAEEVLHNQSPPVSRLSYSELENAPVDWDKLDEGSFGTEAQTDKHSVRPHQKKAIDAVHEYFKTESRGKLIMACGTGKTYTALKIAETETNNSGFVLVLVPSIALIGQTLREWANESEKPINPICICSDPSVAKKKKYADDEDDSVVDLALPASTDIDNIIRQYRRISLNRERERERERERVKSWSDCHFFNVSKY